MQLIEIGLDHATADVTVRERLAVSTSDLRGVLADLRRIAADAVVLSTCNRVEAYLLVDEAETGGTTGGRLFRRAERPQRRQPSGLPPASGTASTPFVTFAGSRPASSR